MRRLIVLLLAGVVVAACGPSTDSPAASLDSHAEAACTAAATLRQQLATPDTTTAPAKATTLSSIARLLDRSDAEGAKSVAKALSSTASTDPSAAVTQANRWCKRAGYVGFDRSWQAACKIWAGEASDSQIFDFSTFAVSTIVQSLQASHSPEAQRWAARIDDAPPSNELTVINDFGDDCARRQSTVPPST
ncbi:MAG TPA: hypothetical protein VFC99_09755, partial [Acidimicrobiia bacterium]|nr:hypothetical protein [Acidimicrobiia bacterium]